MWMNPAVQENLTVLKERGYVIVEPGAGDLACGYTGIGRLPDLPIIEFWLKYALQKTKKLKGKTVLITAGRTEEEIDPVRLLTNRSSGRMGYAIAEQAAINGVLERATTRGWVAEPLPDMQPLQLKTFRGKPKWPANTTTNHWPEELQCQGQARSTFRGRIATLHCIFLPYNN